jgi:hypothetical protein
LKEEDDMSRYVNNFGNQRNPADLDKLGLPADTVVFTDGGTPFSLKPTRRLFRSARHHRQS